MDFDKPYQDGNVLFISLSPKGNETQAPEGRRALTVEGLMELKKWEQTFSVDYQREVMKHLCHLFPFLEDHIEFSDFYWANENIPKWSYPHYFYETSSDFNWREGVVPVSISKRIYFIGKENFPYLGLEGEVLSGFIAAQQILKRYGIEINIT
jgi:monoamine oxidase